MLLLDYAVSLLLCYLRLFTRRRYTVSVRFFMLLSILDEIIEFII